MGFTKLDEGILDSSIMWVNPVAFKVWIALLAKCKSDGIARTTAPGIAGCCFISVEQAVEALKVLESPDEYSKSLNDEGRRIRRIDGGYEIINYQKYREKSHSDTPDAIRMRKKRESSSKKNESSIDNSEQERTCSNNTEHVRTCSNSSASASASAFVLEGDARGNLENKIISLPWNTETFVAAWDRWKKYKKEQHRFKFKCFDSEQSALNKLKRMCDTEKRALDAIEYSVASGYQGIFEERKNTYKPITYASKELMIEPDYHQKAPKREIPVKQPIPEDMFDSDGHLIIKQLSEQELADREAARVEHANNYMAKLRKAIHEKGKLTGGKY
jgi:hypothetical protein